MFSVRLHKGFFKEWLKMEIVRISVVLRTQKEPDLMCRGGGLVGTDPGGTTQSRNHSKNKKRFSTTEEQFIEKNIKEINHLHNIFNYYVFTVGI